MCCCFSHIVRLIFDILFRVGIVKIDPNHSSGEHTANNNKHNILDSSGFVVSPPISAHREKNNTKMFFLHISGDNERLEDVTSPAESHETVKQVALLIRTMLDDLLMKAARRRKNF